MSMTEERTPSPEPLPPRPTIAARVRPTTPSSITSFSDTSSRPSLHRSLTTDRQGEFPRDYSPVTMPRLNRVPTEPSAMLARVGSLRPIARQLDDPAGAERYFERNDSPIGFVSSRTTSWGSDGPASSIASVSGRIGEGKKAPPPPPPNRAKKPPPPPPMKRSAASMGQIPQSPV